MKSIIPFLCAFLCLGAAARADTVVFKNGDKLTGTFVSVRHGSLSLKSDIVGDVTISLDKVQSFSTATETVVVAADRKLIRGQLELQPAGDWRVTTGGVAQTVPESSVNAILTAEKYESLMEAPSVPWRGWKGSANFGFSLQQGDQQTRSFDGAIAATRERSTDLFFIRHWRTNYDLNLLFAKAEQGGNMVSSNTATTNLREDYLFSPQNFVFFEGELVHSDPQGLNLQQAYGGGFGRDVIHSSRTLFSLIGGFNYLHQNFYVGPSNKSVEFLAGEKFGMQVTRRVRLDQHLDFYPDLKHAQRFRLDAAASAALRINTHLAATVGVIDLFLNRPSVGSKQNNIAFTTGVGYTF